MTKYITEILEEVNRDVTALAKYKDQFAIKSLLQYAFDPTKKFILPEGKPPFKRSKEPMGMTPSNFYQITKKLYIFLRSDLKPAKRESLFIDNLESIHPKEAEILIAVKDQDLGSLYPNITAAAVNAAGFDIGEGYTVEKKRVSPRFQDGETAKVPEKKRVGQKPVEQMEPEQTETETTALHSMDVLEKMGKQELCEYAETLGVKLDRRKKLGNMIDELISSF